MSLRLKSSVWVSALLRRCDLAAIPVYVLRRGDPDAGVIYLKVVKEAGEVRILQAVGEEYACSETAGEPLTEDSADGYLERQARYDPDLWVIEVDDRQGRCDGLSIP